MTTLTKAEQSAEHIQHILDNYWKANSHVVRLHSEVATLRGKNRTLEALLEEKERRLILLTELLSRRRDAPRLPSPEPAVIETGDVA